MNRSSLAQGLAQKLHISRQQAEKLVASFGEVIQNALEKNDKIIYSNFGSFYAVRYPSKTLAHPKTGQKMVILPVNVVKFMPSDWLKKYVNGAIELSTTEKFEKELNIHNQSATNIPISVNKMNNKDTNKVEIEDLDDQPKNVPISVADSHTGIEPKDKAVDNQSVLNQAHQEDDIEKYHQHKQEINQKSNLYEEVLSDGSHEFSTVQGAIKIPRKDQKQQTTTASENDEKLSPLESLKRKLGIGKKVKEEVGTLETPLKEDSVPAITGGTNTTHISLAESGIFDKNVAKSPKISNPQFETPQNAESKINYIKEEIKDTNSEPSMLEDSLPSNPMTPPEADKKSPAGPIFSGMEGSFSFDKTRIEYKDLSKAVVPKELLYKIPERIARSYKAVAFEQIEDVVSVAMVDPEDVESREMLKRLLGEKVKIFLATESDIGSILNQYQGLETEVSSAIAAADAEETDEKSKNKHKDDLKVETVSDDAPASKIVTSLLKRAIRDKASDIHIEPTEKEVEVRFRTDGILKKKVSLPKDIQAAVTSRIKILSNLKIDEQRIPQDGRFNIFIDNRRVDFRVSSMPVAFGEKIVMRILDKETGILTIEELGIRGSGLKVVDNNLSKSHGMVLVTGPTGSGKSTTLYAMIQKVYNEGVNIITLEDPIEYQMKGINQSQVNSDIGYTFAAGLRSILRQDPDIIMLGEIRDKETAEMAVHAALTGHVVLSTLHTNGAAGAAPRMIDMGVEPFLLTSSINVVIGQRLVRKLCQECREEIKLPDEELSLIRKEVDKMPAQEKDETLKRETKFFKSKGCKNCGNTGYKGRIGIYEVLEVSPEMQQLILKRVSSEELNNQAISQGMVTMIQDGILKAYDGTTTMEEVWRVTKN